MGIEIMRRLRNIIYIRFEADNLLMRLGEKLDRSLTHKLTRLSDSLFNSYIKK